MGVYQKFCEEDSKYCDKTCVLQRYTYRKSSKIVKKPEIFLCFCVLSSKVPFLYWGLIPLQLTSWPILATMI